MNITGQVSEFQDLPPFLFALLLHNRFKYVRWVFISARSVKNYISVDKNAYLILSKCFCYILPKLSELGAGEVSPILTNTMEIPLR